MPSIKTKEVNKIDSLFYKYSPKFLIYKVYLIRIKYENIYFIMSIKNC